jgi:uncharacterized protein
MKQAAAGPILPRERVGLIDVLRGFALLGVVVQNLIDGKWVHRPENPWDHLANSTIDFLCSGKFIRLFSMLFGVGFAIQLERARERGAPFAGRYLWRQMLLWGIGLLHFVLLWGRQDVLMEYAFLGCVLLLFIRVPGWAVLLCAVLSLGILPYRDPLVDAFNCLVAAGDRGEVPRRERRRIPPEVLRIREQERNQVYRQGTYADTVRLRLVRLKEEQGTWQRATTHYALRWELTLFLVGFWAGRRRILQEAEKHNQFLRRVRWGSLAVVGIGNLVPVQLPSPLAWHIVSGPALTFFYASSIALLYQRAVWRRVMEPFRWVGRFGLSNYIFASVLTTTLFYGYGFGLYQKFGMGLGLPVGLAIYGVLVAGSALWLRWFQFGPVEWVWRNAVWRGIRSAVPAEDRKPPNA